MCSITGSKAYSTGKQMIDDDKIAGSMPSASPKPLPGTVLMPANKTRINANMSGRDQEELEEYNAGGRCPQPGQSRCLARY
jgi:hypothetical protein